MYKVVTADMFAVSGSFTYPTETSTHLGSFSLPPHPTQCSLSFLLTNVHSPPPIIR